MKTPIVDFVENYVNRNLTRLHMPGHKGKGDFGFEKFDITEIDGADVLYNATGIIRESEQNAATLFGTKNTFYSTEGSSLCIRAMLYITALYCKSCGKKPKIAAARNVHKSFVSACALNGVEPLWLDCENGSSLLSCFITPKGLNAWFSRQKETPCAVYITTPDYLGMRLDISGISAVCKKHGAVLLVDNAHGAYLKFLGEDTHPITLGADMCCDSAHKTLPVLTGGAYLHVSHTAPELFSKTAERALSLFATTSPSYIILRSLDQANKILAENYGQKLCICAKKTEELKESLKNLGYTLFGDEPLKITVLAKRFGYEGRKIAEILQENGITVEFYDKDFVVMMLSPSLDDGDFEKIFTAFSKIPRKAEIKELPPTPPLFESKMTIREAMFSQSEEIEVSKSVGRVLSDATVSCPPAIPIAVCGEEITPKAVECFKYYGIEKCLVTKEG